MAKRKGADASDTPKPSARRAQAKPSTSREKPIVHDNGKSRRTPAQLERQEDVFNRHIIACESVRVIAREMSISQETVIADIRHEATRRSKEREAQREYDLTIALARYQGVISKAESKSTLYDTLLSERDGAKVSDHSLDAIIKAQERMDKLIGLDAPTRIDIGLQTLLEALKPPE